MPERTRENTERKEAGISEAGSRRASGIEAVGTIILNFWGFSPSEVIFYYFSEIEKWTK